MKTTAKWTLVAVAVLAQQRAFAQQRDVPVLQQPETVGNTVAWSVGAGFVDLSLRFAEGGAELGLGLAFVESALVLSPSGGDVALAAGSVAGGVLVLAGMPFVDALALAHLGDGKTHHPFVPLLIASYATNLPADAVTIALLGTSWGAPLAFLVGSAVGAATMGVIYGVTSQPVASAAQPPALPDLTHGLVIPMAVSQSTVLTF